MGAANNHCGDFGCMEHLGITQKCSAAPKEKNFISAVVAKRYAGWSDVQGEAILRAEHSLQSLADFTAREQLDPQPACGRKVLLGNLRNLVLCL